MKNGNDQKLTNRFGLLSFAFFRRNVPKPQSQILPIPSLSEIASRKTSTMKYPNRFLWFLFWTFIGLIGSSRLFAMSQYYWNPIISIWTTTAGLTRDTEIEKSLTVCTGECVSCYLFCFVLFGRYY